MVFAHTANYHDSASYLEGIDLDIYHIKDEGEPWTSKTKERLLAIKSAAANIDGHTLEFYRKKLLESSATDKILLYYTDGAMPMENYTEELEILKREITYCKRDNITLLGVGIGTNSPVAHGLDTVQVDDSSGIINVVTHLAKRLGIR